MNFTPSRPTLTLGGRRRLEKELERLRDRLNEATERLKLELRDTDDLNSYSTQEELALMRSRIGELQAALAAQPDGTFPFADGAVALGTVTVEDETGREHSFLIVTSIEADAARGYISLDSPVGAALLGRRPGESVTVSVPRGQREFKVLRVEASREVLTE